MAFAEHQARDDGYQCIALYTYERMPENINFYEGLRFGLYLLETWLGSAFSLLTGHEVNSTMVMSQSD